MLIRGRAVDAEPGLDLTPMIDIVFNLLIFFLIASSFQQAEREMQVALPFATTAGPISAALRELVVNVDREGRVVVGGQTITPDELRARVAQAVQNNPSQKVTVRGDRDASYGAVVRVLDACKGGGVQEPYLDTVIE